jgi:hypothetical protein
MSKGKKKLDILDYPPLRRKYSVYMEMAKKDSPHFRNCIKLLIVILKVNESKI